MWLCAKNKILTNVQRKKRKLTSDALCPSCRAEDESTIHAICDCFACKDLWKMLVKPVYWQNFFSGNTIEWFTYNYKKDIRKLEDLNWRVTFGEAVRRIWLCRN